MSPGALRLPGDSIIPELARATVEAGGRLLVVGGWVRDALIDQHAGRTGALKKDLDLEIYGLTEESVSKLLRPYGFTPPVGRHFPVWRNTRVGIDLALPRGGNDDFVSGSRMALERAVAGAALHRDLTMNAIAWDPLDDSLFDPFGGREDLSARRLVAVDADTFSTDPLRVLRAARLACRMDAQFAPSFHALCQSLDLSQLPVERTTEELRRVLMECSKPSRAIEILDDLGQLRVFAPIDALHGVPQDPHWHPEGDVFVHTMQVIDQAASIGRTLSAAERETLLWAALCHDLGKVDTTRHDGARVRAVGHEGVGAERTRDWLTSLRLSSHLIEQVAALVAHHLAPVQLVSQAAGPRSYRRLARKLDAAGVTLVDLERLARADHLGRTTPEALAGRFDAGREFLRAAEAANVQRGVRADVVPSSLVMRRGIPAGPELGRVLARCREIQDETGWQDPDRILEHVFDERGQAS